MEKFFDQSKDLANKPTGESGIYGVYESGFTDKEKRQRIKTELEQAQNSFNRANQGINDLLSSYKTNFADKMEDEKHLMELSEELFQAETLLKSLRFQMELINKGIENLQPEFNSQSLKN